MEAAAAPALEEEATPEAAISLGGPPAAATVAEASSPWDQSITSLSLNVNRRPRRGRSREIINDLSDTDTERRTRFEPGQMPHTDSAMFDVVRPCCLL